TRSVVTGRVARYAGEQQHREEWDLEGLAGELSVLFMRPVGESELATESYEELGEKAAAAAETAYRARESGFGAELMREVERHLFLFTLDEHWRDHLYELDHLKGGIGLRAYGQRDPLIEYKKEAFSLFETLVNEVNEEFVERLFRVQLDPASTREVERRPAPRAIVAQHAETQSFSNIATTQ